MRRNRLAFDKLGFVPRVLVDVSHIDPSTTLLGMPLRSPVVLAPIGSMQHLSPDGAIGFAKAAAQYGTVMSMSIMTPPSLEEVAASTDAPKIFQLYVQGDLAWAKDVLDRVRAAGYSPSASPSTRRTTAAATVRSSTRCRVGVRAPADIAVRTTARPSPGTRWHSYARWPACPS